MYFRSYLLVFSELVDQTGEQDEDVLRQQGNSKPAILFFCRGGYKELTTICTHKIRVNLSPLLMKSSIITQTAAMMEAKPITKPTSSQILAILAPDSEGFSSEIYTQNNGSESFG